jgi:predicted neutral ceramidase superfamily lipid hydrolase
MSEFWIYFEKGLSHILNYSVYDQILFLMALTVPYGFKNWKKLLLLISIFTVAHTLSLMLTVFDVVVIKVNSIEFLIPITILIVAFYTLFTAGKSSKQDSISLIGFITLFLGIIHGLSCAGYFKTLISSSPQSKFLPLLEYSLGIETAQIIIVFIMLVLSYVVQNFFRFSKRDWTLVISSFVIGMVLPMILSSAIWTR